MTGNGNCRICPVSCYIAGQLQQFVKLRRLVAPVITNMLLTLWSWVYVYDMKTDDRLSAVFPYSGLNWAESFANGLFSIAVLAVVSFAILLLALRDYRWLVRCWLYLSCLLILFVVSGFFFYDLFVKLQFDNAITLCVPVTAIYALIGCAAFFTQRLPEWCHRCFLLTNCSLVSVFYLRSFPGFTAWTVLWCIVLWDVFAVKTSIGPLRKVQEKASDYSEHVLRFLMFTSKDEDLSKTAEGRDSGSEDDASSSSASRCSDEESSRSECDDDADDLKTADSFDQTDVDRLAKQNEPQEKTAADALNDNNLLLGLGDFVFYSVLVGQAATNGCVVSTIAAAFGVIYGLCCTLTFFSNSDETSPALPLSIVLGTACHFTTLYTLPLVYRLVELSVDLLIL